MGLQIRDIADEPSFTGPSHWVPYCTPLKLGLNSLASTPVLCPERHSAGPDTGEGPQLSSVAGLGIHCLSCFHVAVAACAELAQLEMTGHPRPRLRPPCLSPHPSPLKRVPLARLATPSPQMRSALKAPTVPAALE